MTGSRRSAAAGLIALLWILWVCFHAFTLPHSPWPHVLDRPLVFPVFWREAIVRAARGIAGAGIVWLAAWQLGGVALSRMLAGAVPADGDRTLLRLGVGAVALAWLLLLLGSCGLYRRPIVAALVVACAVPSVVGVVRRVGSSTFARPNVRLLDVFLLAIAVAAIAFATIGAFAPETEYDALGYHLWLPVRWLDAGRLVDIIEEVPSLYPGNWELLNGAALTIGGGVAAKLLHLACLPLVGLTTCRLARALHVPVRPTLVFALAVVSPTVIWEGSTAYVELALTWLITLAAVALLRFHDSGERQWLVVGAVLMGGALGVKHLALIALGLFSLMLVARSGAATWRQRLMPAVIVVLLAVGLASPWYIRAAAASGNPVFPEMYEVFGARPAARWSHGSDEALGRFKAHFGLGRSANRLARLPIDVTEHAAAFGGTLGPAFLAFAPLALFSRHRRRLVAIAAAASAYIAVWASPVSSFQLRFLVPIVPCLAVLAAAGVDSVPRVAFPGRGIWRGLAMALLLVLLVFNLPPLIDWQERDRVGWNGWLTHVLRGAPAAVVFGAESERSYLTRTVPTYAAWHAIDAAAPPDARVLSFTSGDHFYATRSQLWSDTAVAYAATWGAAAGHEADALVAARKLAITHVLMDRREFGSPELDRLAFRSQTMRQCCLTPLFDDGRIVVFTLRYDNREGELTSSLMSRR